MVQRSPFCERGRLDQGPCRPTQIGLIHAGQRCPGAPFVLPTDGFIGYLWLDTFQIGHRHQGIDIFGGSQVDQTPVVAAYSGLSDPPAGLEIERNHTHPG